MRKFTLTAFALLCSMLVFPTRYLVQPGGDGAVEWRTAGENEVLVDLVSEEQNLNEWLNINFNGFPAGNEIWLAEGVYEVNEVFNIPANFTLYGGFAGTETSIDEREKGEAAWDFIHETIIDGGNATMIFGCNSNREAYYDGLTLTNASFTGNGGAMISRDGVVIKNCKFTNNSATGQGGAILMNGGGEIYNSCFSGNEASMGGALNLGGSGPHIVSECLFEKNQTISGSNMQGGAIRSQSSNALIEKCIFRNNEAAGNGSAIYTQTDADGANKIINCLIYDNKTKVAVYARGAALYNCTVVNNEAGAVYAANQYGQIYNSAFWGEEEASAAVTGANSAGIIFENNASLATPEYDNWTISDNIVLAIEETEENYPLFSDPANNDWSLLKGSPLIDAGNGAIENSPATDITGTARPQGSAYDIGAYEYVPSPTTGIVENTSIFRYFTTNNTLILQGLNTGDIITIYDITGAKRLNKKADAGTLSVDLNQGMYIISVGNQSKKIIIK